MNLHIPYTQSAITEREVRDATHAARKGWGERGYEYIGSAVLMPPL